MKHHIIILTFFLLLFANAKSQIKYIDVQADYIKIDSFFSHYNNILLRKIDKKKVIRRQLEYNYDYKSFRLTEYTYRDGRYKKDTSSIDVKTLYPYGTDSLLNLLTDVQFNLVDKDGNKTKFNITKNHKVLSRTYRGDSILMYFDTLHFSILRINKRYNIIVFVGMHSSAIKYILPLKKNNFCMLNEGVEQITIEKSEPKEKIVDEFASYQRKCFERSIFFDSRSRYLLPRMFNEESLYSKEIENGKVGLKNILGEEVFPCIYDSIIFLSKYILTMKNGRGDLYDTDFNLITKDVRCVYVISQPCDGDEYIFLENNKLRYILKDFEVSDILPQGWEKEWCRTVGVRRIIMKPPFDYQVKKGRKGFEITRTIDMGGYKILEKFSYYLPGNFKNLTCINGKNDFQDYGKDYFGFTQTKIFVYQNSNDKFGLISVEMPYPALKEYKDILKKYDHFTRYMPEAVKITLKTKTTKGKSLISNLDSVVFSENHDYPLKIYRDGLCNYFPLAIVPKYKEISDFNGYFARFVFPNGRKGWLSKDGKEYLDE